jgi:phage gp46-like protein
MIEISEGDLALFNNLTHGEICVENGQPVMDQGLETAVFISLFSGAKNQFWGNNLNVDEDFNYGGEFEKLAEQLIPTVENAERLHQAILNDLKWMKTKGIAVNIEVNSFIEDEKTILFTVLIERPDNLVQEFKFSNNWSGQFLNPASERI